ncbi:MAG: YbjQ family protein [Acutalibacteraceae bacterium]|nr:YbjQ family protein [Bacillota bacterium]
MVLVNTDYITGQKLQILSIVRGSVVMTKHLGSDIGASFKTLVGGEIKGYTDMLNSAREVATTRMIEDASRFGADAIINVRYTTSSVMQGASEILAVGTAVKFINQ